MAMSRRPLSHLLGSASVGIASPNRCPLIWVKHGKTSYKQVGCSYHLLSNVHRKRCEINLLLRGYKASYLPCIGVCAPSTPLLSEIAICCDMSGINPAFEHASILLNKYSCLPSSVNIPEISVARYE